MFNVIRQKSIEICLNNFAHKPTITNSNWEINPAELKNVSIRWTNKYQCDEASDWVDILLYGFRKLVKVEIVDNISQPYKGTVVFQIIINGKIRDVAVGYSDYLPIDENCVKECDLYFKMQYDKFGYGYSHIVPGGYVSDGKRLYLQLKKLRTLRNQKKYLFDIYGRFGLDYAREIREKAMEILNKQKLFKFEGGMKKVSYDEFLKEIAQSKICIDMPGLGDFCFRLVNYLSIGTCVIAYPHRTDLNIPLVDGKNIVYMKEDFSDLVELCEYYLENDDKREEIAQNARRFFDLYLHKDNLVKYYLRTCLDRFK
ncbi:MAG TPA: glycosyltransferase [Pyrinomonadaceae bacterium]|nr:glycosyltransferase [Pyrinomonadaceae bacterium]